MPVRCLSDGLQKVHKTINTVEVQHQLNKEIV
jgi:hypothetical protein